MDYMGSPIVVGMPLPPDHKADVRIITTIERWDRSKLAETYYKASRSVAHGRDCVVSYAMYRIPRPTHIMVVDSDVLPRPNTLDRLLDLNKDIVTGVYPMTTKKAITWSVVKDELMVGLDELPRSTF